MSSAFTVITVTYNSAATVQRTLSSVLSQTLTDFEYWVIDGGSTDGTLDILRRQTDARLRWVSEPDKGIYHAMNKGIALAQGRYIALLNSDDHFADAGVLQDVFTQFSQRDDLVIYGDLEFFDDSGRIVRRWRSGPYQPAAWRSGWHPPHPSTFIPLALYRRHGGYDEAKRYSADYKLMLQLGLSGVPFQYLPRLLTRMRRGGASTDGLASVLKHNRESHQAWAELGYRAPFALIPRKWLGKVRAHLAAGLRAR